MPAAGAVRRAATAVLCHIADVVRGAQATGARRALDRRGLPVHNSCGSLAMFATIRRALSRVSSFAADRGRPLAKPPLSVYEVRSSVVSVVFLGGG
jgi:hypothetical protein